LPKSRRGDGNEDVTIDFGLWWLLTTALNALPSPSARSTKHWIRFRLRTAFLVLTFVCAFLGWWVVRAERQRMAVAAVRDAGGSVIYTYERDPIRGPLKNPKPWAPAWLRKTLGDDLFITVEGVYCEGRKFDDDAVDRLVPKLRRVSNLRWLELRSTSITDAALGRIAELTQLERLLIRSSANGSERTQITDTGLAQLHTLSGLRFLSLEKCTIDGSAFEHLGTLRGLEELDLRDTEFNNTAARYLHQFTRLTYLNLWKTQITDAAMGEILYLDHLEKLFLSDNLTDSAATDLAKLRRLKVLDLSNSAFSDAAVEALQNRLQLEELRRKGGTVPQSKP
jgi:Leucine-rich repeat (LRR) protein